MYLTPSWRFGGEAANPSIVSQPFVASVGAGFRRIKVDLACAKREL
jgi:hypothetical protein